MTSQLKLWCWIEAVERAGIILDIGLTISWKERCGYQEEDQGCHIVCTRSSYKKEMHLVSFPSVWFAWEELAIVSDEYILDFTKQFPIPSIHHNGTFPRAFPPHLTILHETWRSISCHPESGLPWRREIHEVYPMRACVRKAPTLFSLPHAIFDESSHIWATRVRDRFLSKIPHPTLNKTIQPSPRDTSDSYAEPYTVSQAMRAADLCQFSLWWESIFFHKWDRPA